MSQRRRKLVRTVPWALLFLSCSPGYVLRAGWEEARILSERRDIDAVLEDPATPDDLREKLGLVREVRVFAERRLGLDAGRSFQSFTHTARDTLVLVVSAAPEFELRWKTWWFPIVGHLPYKGFFDFEAAAREADRLSGQGYDTHVRPSAAFSTLGWFPDPILTPALQGDAVAITETVIHEITHTTFFAGGQAPFNESFANFMGHRGAIEFFCEARADEQPCLLARDRWHDAQVFAEFFRSVKEPLETLYASGVGEAEMRRGKRRVIREAAERYERDYIPVLRSGRYGRLNPATLDNAWLLSRLLYYERLSDFEAVYRRHGSLRPAFEAIVEIGDSDPWAGLDALLLSASGD